MLLSVPVKVLCSVLLNRLKDDLDKDFKKNKQHSAVEDQAVSKY